MYMSVFVYRYTHFIYIYLLLLIYIHTHIYMYMTIYIYTNTCKKNADVKTRVLTKVRGFESPLPSDLQHNKTVQARL